MTVRVCLSGCTRWFVERSAPAEAIVVAAADDADVAEVTELGDRVHAVLGVLLAVRRADERPQAGVSLGLGRQVLAKCGAEVAHRAVVEAAAEQRHAGAALALERHVLSARRAVVLHRHRHQQRQRSGWVKQISC